MGPLETEVRALWRQAHLDAGLVEPTVQEGEPQWLIHTAQLGVTEALVLHAAQMNALMEIAVRLARVIDGGDEDPTV